MTEALDRYTRARLAKEKAEAEYADAQEDLIKEMKDQGIKSMSGTVGKLQVKATLVEGTIIDIDQARLKKAVGAQIWNRISSRVLDKAKLEQRMAAGEVDAVVVAGCSEERPKKAYIKPTITPAAKGKK